MASTSFCSLALFLLLSVTFWAQFVQAEQLYKNAAIYLYGSSLSCAKPGYKLQSKIQLLCACRYREDGVDAKVARYACLDYERARFNIFRAPAPENAYVYIQMVDSGLCLDTHNGIPGYPLTQNKCDFKEPSQLFNVTYLDTPVHGCPSTYKLARITYHPMIFPQVKVCLTTGPEHINNQICLPNANDPTQNFLILNNQPIKNHWK